MRQAVGPSAAFLLGMVATATLVFAPMWTQTRVTYCDYFPPPGEKEWKVPPGVKVGTYTDVFRVPFWESDIYQSLRKQ